MITFGSLFAGIGGFDLGFERAGMHCAWQVENNPDCIRVLEKHWPNVQRITNIEEAGRTNLGTATVICGGFPCQPFSVSGKKLGEDDDRNKWPEMYRIISEIRPRWIVAENVDRLVTTYLDTVLDDMASEGYTSTPLVIPAAAFGLPHLRNRLFVVAYSDSVRLEAMPHESRELTSPRSETEGEGNRPGWVCRTRGGGSWAIPNPGICRAFDGISGRMDESRVPRHRLIGNAVVPAAAEWIGRVIVNIEKQLND